jgi:putative endonuclease
VVCDIHYRKVSNQSLKSCHSDTASAVRNLLSCGVAMVRDRYYLYIMASKGRVIYVGMTGFLMARVLRHKAGTGGAFTRKYRVHRQWHLESNASCDKTFGCGFEFAATRAGKLVRLLSS